MQPTGSSIHSIFIADDDQDDTELFSSAILHINPDCKVYSLKNGIELISLIHSHRPDILFLDLDMPFMNGLQCLVEIKKDPRTNTLPVIIFSSSTRASNIEAAYELGADLFLIKPNVFSSLTESLKLILSFDWSDPAKVKEQYCINGRYLAFA